MRDPVVVGGRYRNYMLIVLAVVFAFSYLDRQILSILAEEIKRDLDITDSQMGFLYGTAFGVFYAVFGIPLGRMADFVSRKKLLAAGLASWSVMTVFSGFAANFAQLAVARIGVGIGEATASPCAYSMLSDSFAKARRASVLAVYASGLYVGMGLSTLLGGNIVGHWGAAVPGDGGVGLSAWQAAFILVGTPGVFMAAWVLSLREPIRGESDGIISPEVQDRWRKAVREFASTIPPFTIFNAARFGKRAFATHVGLLTLTAASAWLIARSLGDYPQWIALGLGVYATCSWIQSLRWTDRPTFDMIFGSATYMLTIVGFSLVSLVNAVVSFWAAPYAIRILHVDPAVTGITMGTIAAICGFVGVIGGGWMADRLFRRYPTGRLMVGLVSTIGMVPPIIGMIHAASPNNFFAWFAVYATIGAGWTSVASSTTQSLVHPTMRGTAAATNILLITLIGLCVGPYAVGRISMATGDLGRAILWSLVAIPAAVISLLFVYRRLLAAASSAASRANPSEHYISHK